MFWKAKLVQLVSTEAQKNEEVGKPLSTVTEFTAGIDPAVFP